jgi:hypothetical protein
MTNSSNPIPEELRASIFSSAGFLGSDTRSVEKIVEADIAALKKLGVAKEKLARVLSEVFDKASAAMGKPVDVRDGVVAVYHESRGRIPSPFREDGSFEKGEVVITDTASNEALIITRLSINLIERHDFFQGRGSRYRIDPATAVRALKIVK